MSISRHRSIELSLEEHQTEQEDDDRDKFAKCCQVFFFVLCNKVCISYQGLTIKLDKDGAWSERPQSDVRTARGVGACKINEGHTLRARPSGT